MNIWSVTVNGIHELVIHEYMITNSQGYSWNSYSRMYDQEELGAFMKSLFMNIWSLTVRGIHEVVIHKYMITNSYAYSWNSYSWIYDH